MTQANITKAIAETAIAPTSQVDVVYAGAVAVAYTVPALTKYLVFSANKDFYARIGGTAVVPAAGVTDGTGSMLNPTVWHMENQGITTISFIAPAADTIVTVMVYK